MLLVHSRPLRKLSVATERDGSVSGGVFDTDVQQHQDEVLLARVDARQGRIDLAGPALAEARGRALRGGQAAVLRQIALVESEFINMH